MRDTALHYGIKACETMMKKFDAPDLPPKGWFHYHAGVFLSGMMKIYELCGDERLFNYTKEWVDSVVVAPDIIKSYMKGSLDDYMPGILLFPLYERTGDDKYSASLDMMMANIKTVTK